LAFQRTGGVKDLRKNTASLLAKLEQTVSNVDKTGGEKKAKTKK
jgi:hypothetical protein